MSQPLIDIQNLKTYFHTDDGLVKAVDDVSFSIPKGKTVGVVGESGCGKSVTAMSVIRLISKPGSIDGGSIKMNTGDESVELSTLPEDQMRQIRGGVISMIFQEPMTSLNPVFTIGNQILEAIQLHQNVSSVEAQQIAIDILDDVRISEPAERLKQYPHEFSGGMRQRAMIAMALCCNPELLIADEPTTALDVTIQAQILDLLRGLQAKRDMSILLITHDLGIIAEMADEVVVMYASKVVERAPIKTLFEHPLHPYTFGLFNSRPEMGRPKDQKLETIEGMVPSPLRFPQGCKFHPRCKFSQERCSQEEPEIREIEPGHEVRCHFAETLELT